MNFIVEFVLPIFCIRLKCLIESKEEPFSAPINVRSPQFNTDFDTNLKKEYQSPNTKTVIIQMCRIVSDYVQTHTVKCLLKSGGGM